MVLNADELSFYDGEDGRVLYFDPTTGTYKFMGELNVSDKFIVDKQGNVTMKGSVQIDGSLSMTGTSNWLLTRYSANQYAAIPDDWAEAWNGAWDNTSTQVWAIYSYNGGMSWTQPMLVQGKDGKDGEEGPQGPAGLPGSDANIPNWVRAYTASAQFGTLVTNEWVVTMNLYGSKIYGTEIYGGRVTSGTSIEVETDASIGDNLYLGKLSDGLSTKSIYFNNLSRISGSGEYLSADCAGLSLGCSSYIIMKTLTLDLSGVQGINWGSNAPRAVFA